MLTIAVVKSLTKLSDCGVVLQSKLGNPQAKLIHVHTSVDHGTYLAKATSKRDNMEIEDKDIQWASQHFLTESLPDDWQKMSDEEVDEFIENHKWQPIEYWEAKDIWQQIGQVARSMRDYIKHEQQKEKDDKKEKRLV